MRPVNLPLFALVDQAEENSEERFPVFPEGKLLRGCMHPATASITVAFLVVERFSL